MDEAKSTVRQIVVRGETHTLEERPDGAMIEVIQRDKDGFVVQWYRRKAAPDASVPLVGSPSFPARFRF